MPLYVASLPIFSKVYYDKRPFDESTLDIPLGSGPYRVGIFEVEPLHRIRACQGLVGARLPVRRAPTISIRCVTSFIVIAMWPFEGFTARNYLFREEFTARVWATRYDFPAIKEGRVKRETCRTKRPLARRAGSSTRAATNSRIRACARRSVNAFDFEWTNKTIMYGAYARTVSPFQNSDMMAKGPPSPQELALLEPFRGKVPNEVFSEPYMPPVTDGSGQDRNNLLAAAQLLRDAGCAVKDGKRLLPNGEVLKVEFLVDEPSLQPHHAPYIKNLGTLGIEASLRVVDPVQYRARLNEFDFDITMERFSLSATPGDSMRPFFTSQAATTKGSYNLAGIADPVIDALVERIVGANSREELTVACRAFDRVFRAGRYWMPQWYRTKSPDGLLGRLRSFGEAAAFMFDAGRGDGYLVVVLKEGQAQSRRNKS